MSGTGNSSGKITYKTGFMDLVEVSVDLDKREIVYQEPVPPREFLKLRDVLFDYFMKRFAVEDFKNKSNEILVELTTVLQNYGVSLSDEQLKAMLYYVYRDTIGFGVIDPIMWDENVEDIKLARTPGYVGVVHAFNSLLLFHRSG